MIVSWGLLGFSVACQLVSLAFMLQGPPDRRPWLMHLCVWAVLVACGLVVLSLDPSV